MSNWIHLRPCISSPCALLFIAALMEAAKPFFFPLWAMQMIL